MEFENLDAIKQIFDKKSSFSFPDDIYVSGIKYKKTHSSSYSMRDIIERSYKPLVVYSTASVYREEAKTKGLEAAIIFLWGYYDQTNFIAPYDVRTITHQRLQGKRILENETGGSISVPTDKIIGDVVDVMITSISGSQPIKGKVDTGADVSSLHADKWDIQGDQVTFISPDLSENQITMPVIEKQAIKLSNGTTEYRPVIELNIKINGQQLPNCMFNLNDRGAMNYSILIGQNVLEAGKFMIDPTINDPDAEIREDLDIDWVGIQEMFKDDDVSNEYISMSKLKEAIDNIK